MCGGGGGGGGGLGGAGGYFYIVVLMLFLNSELNTKSFSCQTNRVWKNIFIDYKFLTLIFSII